jgi:hypothetical protein
MLTLRYSGWVSCRLATDPDPFDDPRGNLSSFQQFAYAGEPDLDRTIYFQNPPFVRPHCEPVGVSVKSVVRGAGALPGHALTGAAVNLLGSPVHEGRNGAVSNAQSEPIVPFHMELRQGGTAVSRALMPKNADYPFPELFPVRGGVNPNTVIAATGKSSPLADWDRRLQLLGLEHASAPEENKPGLEERMAMMRDPVNRATASDFLFTASMRWRHSLNGPVSGTTDALFGAPVSVSQPWVADLWFGGFDMDAQSFFCAGTLSVPEAGEQPMMADASPGRSRAMARART